MRIVAVILFTAGAISKIGFAAESVDQLYASLAKLPADQRAKHIGGGRAQRRRSSISSTLGAARTLAITCKLFEKRYPFIKFEMGDIGSQDAAERFIAEETAGRHLTDILTLGVPDMAVILKQNLVAKLSHAGDKKNLKAIPKLHRKENRWMPWYWAEHGISYNTNLVKPDKAPKAWFDLCNPDFKGQVSFDPSETRFLAGLYVMMGEAKTKEWLKCIGQNQPIVQTGHTQRMELMLTGDHAVQGDNYLYSGMEAKKKDPKAPFAMVLTAPILSFAGGMIINKNTQKPLCFGAVRRLDAVAG